MNEIATTNPSIQNGMLIMGEQNIHQVQDWTSKG
jgi:hypothetical protein